jgi:para-aminobenzoate synthetase
VHGRRSTVVRASRGGHECPLLYGLPNEFDVVRYHSLAVCRDTLPDELQVTAWTQDRDADGQDHPVIMAVRHALRPLYGVQFHPESVQTEHGSEISDNFLRIALARRVMRPQCPIASQLPSRGCEPVPTHPCLSSRAEVPPSNATRQFVTRHVHLRSVYADPADVFSALFSNSNEAFWLDSSSAAVSPRVSRCSSEDLSQISDMSVGCNRDAEATSQVGRLSMMGDASGPLAEIVSYDVNERAIAVRSNKAEEPGSKIVGTSIFAYLKEQLRERHIDLTTSLAASPVQLNGGYVGVFGYEAKADVTGVLRNSHESSLPDAWFIFADRLIAFDHVDNSVHLIAIEKPEQISEEEEANSAWLSNTARVIRSSRVIRESEQGLPRCGPPLTALFGCQGPLRFYLERGRSSYEADIARCLELIGEGESYEICLTNRLRTVLSAEQHFDPLELYLTLRLINPAPYAAYLRLGGDVAVCCSSPERFICVRADGAVESRPIKGTRPRGSSLGEDKLLADDLRTSVKDRSENLMIVDLVRNDLGRTCLLGSVNVPVLMKVETYASVHQLVSAIRGRVAPEMSVVDCVREAYPMGSMTGAPKLRTMSLIDRLETSARGLYSGTIGYMSLCGAVDLNVVIRTAVVNGPIVEIGVGGAIVALSNPVEEYFEALVKGRPLLRAVALVTTGSDEYEIDDQCEAEKNWDRRSI